MIGNAFQIGIPDLYCFNRQWGERWIDVKVEGRYSFTRAQKHKWPIWESFGVGIWILTGADQANYDKLFKAPNWRAYWKSSWNTPDIDRLLDELDQETEPMVMHDDIVRHVPRPDSGGDGEGDRSRRQ